MLRDKTSMSAVISLNLGGTGSSSHCNMGKKKKKIGSSERKKLSLFQMT